MAKSKTYEMMLKIGGKADSSLRAACAVADKNLSSLGTAAKNMGKVIGGAAIAGVTAVGTLGVAAIKAAAEYETQMANISTLLTGTEAQVAARTGEIGEQILTVSNKTGVATANLTDGMYQVISAFGDSADAIGILETAAKSAAAGNATTSDAINLLSAVTKGYGDTSAAAVQKAADLSFATVRLGQTSFPELATAMGKVIPLAGTLGVEQEQLFGAMATLTGVTGGTAEVVTQLKATMQAFLAPNKNMANSLKAMGYESGQALLQSEGLQGAMEVLKGSVGGNELAFAGLFSSVEAQTAVLAMAGSQAEALTSKTAEMYQATGAADTAFQRQTGTMQYTIQTIKTLGANFLTELGTNVLPYVKDLAESALPKVQDALQKAGTYVVNTIIPAVKNTVGWIRENSDVILALAGGIGAAVLAYKAAKGVIAVYNTVTSLSKILGLASAGATAAQTAATVGQTAATTGAIAPTTTLAAATSALCLPMLAVVAIIAGVVAAVILLVKNWDWVKTTALNVWNAIKGAWNAAADWFGTKVITPLVNFFSGLVTAVSGFFGGLWAGIKGAWDTVATWFDSNVITPVVNFFSGLVNSASGLFNGLWAGIKGTWNTVATWFKDTVVTPLVNFFIPIINTVSGIFQGCRIIVQAVWKAVSSWFNTNVIMPLIDFFSGLVVSVSGFFKNLWEGIKRAWSTASAWFSTSVVTPVVNAFYTVVDMVSGFFTTLWDGVVAAWTAAGAWFSTNVVTPVVNAFHAVVDAVGGFFTGLWDSIVSVWTAAGTWFGENVATPIMNAFQAVSDFAKGIFNGLIGIVESLINRVITGINGLVGGFSNIVGKAAAFIGVEWGGIPEIPQVTLPRLATGGIVTAPTILEAGEGGEPEAILPLSKLATLLGKGGKKPKGDDGPDPTPERGGGGQGNPGDGGDGFTFAPVFHFHGPASKKDVEEAMKMGLAEFKRLHKQMEAEKRRKAFNPA